MGPKVSVSVRVAAMTFYSFHYCAVRALYHVGYASALLVSNSSQPAAGLGNGPRQPLALTKEFYPVVAENGCELRHGLYLAPVFEES